MAWLRSIARVLSDWTDSDPFEDEGDDGVLGVKLV